MFDFIVYFSKASLFPSFTSSSFHFFKDFIYLFERHRMRARDRSRAGGGSEGEGEGEADSPLSRKPASVGLDPRTPRS